MSPGAAQFSFLPPVLWPIDGLRPRLPRTRDEDREIFSGPEGRSPDDASHSPQSAYPTESSRDMLGRKESAAACRSLKIEQVCCHPQTPPWNGLWIADGQLLPLFPAAGEIICTPQSPRTLCSSGSLSRW